MSTTHLRSTDWSVKEYESMTRDYDADERCMHYNGYHCHRILLCLNILPRLPVPDPLSTFHKAPSSSDATD